jgi:hypothetical protein
VLGERSQTPRLGHKIYVVKWAYLRSFDHLVSIVHGRQWEEGPRRFPAPFRVIKKTIWWSTFHFTGSNISYRKNSSFSYTNLGAYHLPTHIDGTRSFKKHLWIKRPSPRSSDIKRVSPNSHTGLTRRDRIKLNWKKRYLLVDSLQCSSILLSTKISQLASCQLATRSRLRQTRHHHRPVYSWRRFSVLAGWLVCLTTRTRQLGGRRAGDYTSALCGL